MTLEDTSVIFVDVLSRPRKAILTAIWNNDDAVKYPNPAVNLVTTNVDPKYTDSYGRQIERHTSVPHVSNQPAPGFYWCRLTEYNPSRDKKLREVNK